MRERDVEKYLVKRVKEMGGEVRKVKWIGRNGAPDRVVMLPVKNIPIAEGFDCMEIRGPVWVELKAPGKKPEAHQLREHARMRKMCQQVQVIDSLEGVDRFLGSLI